MEALGSLPARRVRCLIPALIFLLTFVAFLPVLQNDFVNWDDDELFLENPHYRGLGWTQLRWMFTTFYMGHYQPLSWVTFGLDYLIWGMEPFGYHLTNLLLHAANSGLFYFLTLRFFSLTMAGPASSWELGLRVAAAFSSLFFAIHPLRVESVAWATERRDVLSGLFFFLSILFYLRATTIPAAASIRMRWMTIAVVVYGLSLLSKASGITLPIVLLVLDLYPLGRLGGGPGKWFGSSVRRVWWEKVPFLLLAVTFGSIALLAQREAQALKPLERYDFTSRGAQALFGIVFYLRKTVFPLGLSPLYQLSTDPQLWDWPFLLSGLVVLSVSIGLFVLRHRLPAGLASWVCYVVILAPVLGIAQSGPQLVADRYSYLSCLVWAMLAGAGVLYCWKLWVSGRIGRRIFVPVIGLATVVLIGLGTLTWQQTQVWHDSERLWRHVLTIDQNSSYAHHNLARILENRGMTEEAIGHYHQAVRSDPLDAGAHSDLGLLLTKRGEFEQAIEHFRQAVRINPSDEGFHANLGLALAKGGNLEEAMKHFRHALELDPEQSGAASIHLSLGNILGLQGRFGDAEAQFRQAIRIQPDLAEAHEDLGRALARQGKTEEAVKHYNEALRILKSRPKASDAR